MNLLRGGGPRNVYSMVRLLLEKGYDANILTFMDPRSRFLQRENNAVYASGADFLVPGKLNSFAESHLWRADNIPLASGLAINISRLMRYGILNAYPRADAYVATYWQSFYPVYSLCQKERIPMLYFVQANETTFGSTYFYKKFAERTYQTQSTRVTQSKWLKRFLDEKYGGENHYIGFGIDRNKFRPRNYQKENVIFTIARSSYDKGFDVFIKALNVLWSRRKDFKVIIAGDTSALKQVEIDFPYDFVGWITDDNKLAELYSKSIFVNTGRHEALPMPPLEAMSCGSAVVLTDMEGIREYAVDNVNCLIAQNGDWKSVSDRVEEVMSSETLRKKISSGGLNTSSNYDWKSVCDRFVTVLNEKNC